MKVTNITISTDCLKVTPIEDRLYKVAEDTTICVYIDEGLLRFKMFKGFTSNFRSGGVFVDKFVDQIGDEKKSLCYLFHDMAYTPCAQCGMEHPVSRKFADQLLKAGLLWAGMGKFKASLVYNSVRLFGDSAYEEDDALTSSNSKLFTFYWDAKQAA